MVLPSLATMMTVPRTTLAIVKTTDYHSPTLQSDTTSNVDGSSDSQVIQFQDPRDTRNSLLEIRNFLKVGPQFDQRSGTESRRIDHKLAVLHRIQVTLDEHQVRASLDRQEPASRNIDTVGILEVADSRTDGSLELDDREVGIARLVGRDGLAVGNDLQLKLIVLDNALDGVKVEPNVVGVEVPEFLDGLEILDVLPGDLCKFKETNGTLVIDNGTTLDVGLGLVGKLHDVLGLSLNHVPENAQIDNSTQIVDITEEEVLNAAANKLVQDTRVLERLEDVTVARWVPIGNGRVGVLGNGEERVLCDPGVPGLVEGEDINIVALVLFDDVGGVIIGVERIHQDERDVDTVDSVQVLDLTNRQVQEGHALTNLDDRLGSDASHRGPEATVELEDSELGE